MTDTQRDAIERLERRVQAMKGKKGREVHIIGLLRAAKHQILAAGPQEEAKDG